MEVPSRTIESPAVPSRLRRIATLAILLLLLIGFVILSAVAVLSLATGSERTLTFGNQDFPFDNTNFTAGISTSFWLRAGESIRPDLVERVTNRSSAAFVWQGPVHAVFLHYRINETGPAFWPEYVTPRDGYYTLEIHHHGCQDDVDLCSTATRDLAYRTSGTVRVVSPDPDPFLTPSVAVLTATVSVTGISVTSWRLARRRSRMSSDSPGIARAASWKPVIAALLLVLAIVIVGTVSLDAVYRPRVSAQASGFGSWGFAADNPCIPGQANVMVLYVSAYNGANEPVTVWVEVHVGGAADRVAGIPVPSKSMSSVGVALYSSTDCKDPAAQVRITGIWPSWS